MNNNEFQIATVPGDGIGKDIINSAPALIICHSHLNPPIILEDRSTIEIAEFIMSFPIPSPGTVAI